MREESIPRWLVCVSLAFAIAAWPAVATPVEDTEAAIAASLLEPAAGTEGWLPVEFFLQNADFQPDLVETMKDRLRGLRGAVGRALRSLGGEETDPGVEPMRAAPEPVLDVAIELGAGEHGADSPGRELADRIRNAETTRAEAAARAILSAHDIGLRNAPMLGADVAGGVGPGARSVPAPIEQGKLVERPPWRLLVIVREVLDWIRDQPLLTVLVISLLGFVFWVRQTAQRA